jgi:hypothetical protein
MRLIGLAVVLAFSLTMVPLTGAAPAASNLCATILDRSA